MQKNFNIFWIGKFLSANEILKVVENVFSALNRSRRTLNYIKRNYKHLRVVTFPKRKYYHQTRLLSVTPTNLMFDRQQLSYALIWSHHQSSYLVFLMPIFGHGAKKLLHFFHIMPMEADLPFSFIKYQYMVTPKCTYFQGMLDQTISNICIFPVVVVVK